MGREFPDNGLVDADGRLTDAGRDAVLRFLAAYPNPLTYLEAVWPGVYRGVRVMIGRRGRGMEEFRQSVAAAASRYIRLYDPTKGADLVKSFLPRSIVHAGRDWIDADMRSVRTTRFNTEHKVFGGDDEFGVTEVLSREHPPWHAIAVRDEYERAVSVLSPAQRTAMTGRFVDGLTTYEMADRMGVTRQRVCQLCDEGAAKVRRRVNARRVSG